jgi:signal transduction histidine kinase
VKLTPKLMLIFGLLAVVPIIVVSLLAYYYGRQSIEKEILNHLISTNILKSSELHRWIEDEERSLEELGQRPLVKQYASILSIQDPSNPGYAAAARTMIEEHFKPRIRIGGGFIELFLLHHLKGSVIISTRADQEGKIRDNENYFLLGKKGTYLQSVQYSQSLEQATMIISTPLKDDQGALVGVLAGRLDLAELSGIIIQQSGLSQSEDSFLVNTFNYFITEPRYGQGYALKKTVRTEDVMAGLAGKDGWAFYDDYRGTPVIGAYKWLPEYSMCLISKIDQAEAYAPIYALARMMILVACLIALLVFLVTFLVARSISRPVQKLVSGTQEIGCGNLDFRVATRVRDEIGDLSRAFDRMTSELKTTLVSRDELASEVVERKKTEAELRRSNAELERFAYVSSHDLQEPLRMVTSYVQLLEKRYKNKLDQDADDFIYFAVDGAKRMQNLINDLLAYSRVDSRTKPFQPVNMENALRVAVNNLSVAINENEAVITNGPLPTVMADEGQIIQVFQNLLSNAVKFHGSQPPKVHVSALKKAGEWIFAVQDNGIGIEPQYFERIFEIFQRLHGHEYPGTGAGLSIAMRIVERHGGRIWLESRPGIGSTFYFSIPL